MRTQATTLSILLLAGLAAGCGQYQRFDSVGHLREQYAEQVGAATAAHLIVPFELDGKVRAAIEGKMHPASSELRNLNSVLNFIFEDLDLHYSLNPTRTAVETFQEHRGNCLSFVNLFVGLARERRLNPFYVEVTDYQKWNHRAGMVVSQGHIVAGMYLDGELKTYDFLPYRPKAYKDFKPIDDLTAAAHFYNNLGAEALMGGDLPGALELYQKGLAIDPDNAMILTNMTRAYQQLGRTQEADDLLARIEASNTSNPFFFVYQGEMALSRGENQKALDYMVKALRLDTEAPEVHVGFVKVYLALGEMDKARHHLERALKLDATNQDALQLASLLGR